MHNQTVAFLTRPKQRKVEIRIAKETGGLTAREIVESGQL